ncbi:replicative DNA helicase [Henriciella mobilis]|uniref:Replicative DNA helicase n=1 Tax=Henriciella mobilis TaxID=2305467 RepID=A0A399R8W6_9PROT|nr:replicative DNA helicase [Henriciella mobilis]RIJ15674.1 replicative DNA helicase [Henriciella mobilis]RIJ19138.1 replicative DNA helicase [Henriciella mobilis]RIJ27870.1 replicative DNA helicase [Henriciella mobilis]
MNDMSNPPSTMEAPHNLSAEAAVIGAILYDNNAFQRVADVLRPGDFYSLPHQEIFEVCANMIQSGRVADGITLREHFEKGDKLQDIGGAAYLAELLKSAAFGPEISDYAHMIRDFAMRRELIDIGASVQQRALKPAPDENGDRQLELAERSLFDLADRGSSGRGFHTFASALKESLQMAEAAYQRDGKIAGIASHLDDLDQKLGGFHSSDLIILAGRPSMGKTTLATNIAFNAAHACRRETQDDGSKKTVEGAVVAFFSLEMSCEQLATRIIAERTGINAHRIRQGDLDKHDFEKIREATEELQNLPLYIDDQGGISVSQLSARARRLKRTVGLDMIVIDYLQLLTGSSGKSNENRVQEITQITMSLKALAKDLNVPVIALSQLSRQVEQRDDKRPQLSDLRESGSIEQDADVVMFVYRESYYLERTEPQASPDDPNAGEKWAKWRQRMDEVYGTAEVIIGKQRHGPIGRVVLAFDANTTRFGNLERAVPEGDFDE